MLDSLVRVSRRAEWNHVVNKWFTHKHKQTLSPTQKQVTMHTINFLMHGPTMMAKARSTTHNPIETCYHARYGNMSSLIPQQSRKSHQSHSLLFQQFQILLNFFSKFFSPFPHGTFLLSVSSQYLAFGEIYHPLCAPITRNVTLRRYAGHERLQVKNGTLTLSGCRFQDVYTCTSVGNTS